MSKFFDASLNRVAQGSIAKSAAVNDLRDAIGGGFDLMPEAAPIQIDANTFAIDSGLANAYVVTSPNPNPVLLLGQQTVFVPLNDNTGPSTINLDGFGVKGIKRPDGSDLQAGDIETKDVLAIRYNGSSFFFTGADPASSHTEDIAAATSAANALISENAAAGSEAAAISDEASAASSYASTVGSASAAAVSAGQASAAEDEIVLFTLPATNTDKDLTASDAVDTASDVVDTAADRVITTQDALDTAADLVLTAADVVTAEADAVTVLTDPAPDNQAILATSRMINLDAPVGKAFRDVTWSPELGLFAAVASTGTNRIITSPDGFNWTERTATSAGQWFAICWSPDLTLFCAVSYDGPHAVYTSPDGINWTARTALRQIWKGVAWGNGVFVAVAITGTRTTRIMTSPDGTNWTYRDDPVDHDDSMDGIEYSPELGLFVALGQGQDKSVITSPDGINWTTRTTPSGNTSWSFLTWSKELGLWCAVASTGSLLTMTSPNGIDWTLHSSGISGGSFGGIVWCAGLKLFLLTSRFGVNKLYTSPDGITFTPTPEPYYRSYHGICWSEELSMAVMVAADGTTDDIARTL